jgi:hypothetical protein
MKLNNFFNLNEQTIDDLPVFSATTTGVTIINVTSKTINDIKNMATNLLLNSDKNNTLEFKFNPIYSNENNNSFVSEFQKKFNDKYYPNNKQNTISLSGLSGTNTTGTSTSGSNFAADLLKGVVYGSVDEEIKRIKNLL